MILMDEKALRKRLDVVYGQMRERAKPKYYKAGRRKGQIRVPGIVGLPFTREQFWQHALRQIGPNVIQCPYCFEIGRPANLITLANCVFDHKIPLDRGGTWELSNIIAVCADCNNAKGKLTYDFFIGIMAAIEEWPDQRDRTNMHMCLRTHGVTMRMRFPGKNKEASASEPEAPTTMALALKEDW